MLWILSQQLQFWRDALVRVPLSLLPSSPEKTEFPWGQNPRFQQPMVVHRTHLPSTLPAELSSPPTPWLSLRPTDSAELSSPHAETGHDKSLKAFWWLLFFSACLSAFSDTVNFPFTFFPWKQLQLFEFLIFLFNHIDFLTLLVLLEGFRYSWIKWQWCWKGYEQAQRTSSNKRGLEGET